MSKKTSLKVFPNGATARLHNRRIEFEEHDGETRILFSFCEKDAQTPACGHRCDKGKIRKTFICLSNEAMEALVMSYLELKRYQQKKK